jgi:hypothetical protein
MCRKEWVVMFRTLGRVMWYNSRSGYADSKQDATRMTMAEAQDYVKSATGMHPDWWCEIRSIS